MSGRANIPITYQGVTYPTMRAACEAAGIYSSIVRSRSIKLQISKQEAFDQLIAEEVRPRKNRTTIIFQGVTYNSLSQACEVAGINPRTVQSRSHRLQISKQEAFDQVVAEGTEPGKIPIVYRGITYPTLKSACEAANIAMSTVQRRSSKLHISIQEAFDLLVEDGARPRKIPIVYQGVTYPTIKAACEAAGVNPATVHARSRKLQISQQEAFDHLLAKGARPRKKSIPITYQGITYPNVTSACDAAGIDPSTLYRRYNKSQISEQEAFNQLVLEGPKSTKISIKYQGVTYPSLRAACKVVDVDPSLVRIRSIKLKISPQEAFDMILSDKDDPRFMSKSIGASSNDLIEVKHAYVSRSGTTYLTCTCKTCNRRILLPYETAKNYRHAEEFCVDHEYKGRH